MSRLTLAQRATLKAAIIANPAWDAHPADNVDANFALADLLNAPASPAFTVWRTAVPVDEILDRIAFSIYTPNDAITSTEAEPLLTRKLGWLLTIQTKQMNLQLMLQGRSHLDCSKPNVRGGLRDAVIQVPSGVGGAMTSPGGASGANVLTACTRNATEAERILIAAAQGSDTTGATTARVLGFEGAINHEDLRLARL